MSPEQSNLNRLQAQYNLIMQSDLFNQEERDQLRPSLEKRIANARYKLEEAARDYEVQGAIEVHPNGAENQLQ